MATFLLSGVLVGLPAGLGTYLAISPRRSHNAKASAFLLFYAAVLCAAFVIIVPDGAFIEANYRVKMPSAYVIGVVVGAVAGVFQRFNRRT